MSIDKEIIRAAVKQAVKRKVKRNDSIRRKL